ncbi:hypothetical protein C9I56_36420 [Paraburkholderia caribensis]|nr:hypothetical protein C9I56_36420 [Paraburkholderia caribensis]
MRENLLCRCIMPLFSWEILALPIGRSYGFRGGQHESSNIWRCGRRNALYRDHRFPAIAISCAARPYYRFR